jgi:hypothetical protein
MNERIIALKSMAIIAFVGIMLSIFSGCQGAPPVANGVGPKVLFFSSDT